jgi:hypothetical protein
MQPRQRARSHSIQNVPSCVFLRHTIIALSTLPLDGRKFCRPQHSLLPLASLLEAELNRDYYEGQEKELVQKVIAAGTVLIAWKHNNMQVIANAILGNKTSAPQYWPLDRFDLVWVFDRRGDTWTFTQVPQLLLAGDRPEVID